MNVAPHNFTRQWTDKEDRFLIFYGRCIEHEFIGMHDLGCEPGEATKRMDWLRKNNAPLVIELEADADRDIDI